MTMIAKKTSRLNGVLGWIGRFLADSWGVIFVLLLWQAIVTFNRFNAIVLPQPIDVLFEIAGRPGFYLANLGQTLGIAALGLVIGMALGTLLAIIAWWSRIIDGLLMPLSLIFSSIPVVTIIPILARILGYNIETVLAIVAILCFFPAFVFTASGLRSAPAGSKDLLSVLGASRYHTLIHVALPSALPNWMIALRLAVSSAILGAMTAEFLMMRAGGLGAMLHTSANNFNTAMTMGASVIATIVSVTAFLIVVRLEARVRDRWT